MKPLTDKQRSLHARAKRRYEKGDFAGAAEACRQVLKKTPTHPEVLFDLAQSQMRQRETSQAVQTLKRLLKVSPGQQAAHVNLALCYRDQGHYDRALRTIDDALSRRQSSEALAVKAELYQIMGDFERGYDLLKPHVETGSGPPGVVFQHARLCARLDRMPEARSHLEALQNRSDVPRATRGNAMFELATVYETLGEYDRAWATCVEANDSQEDRFDPAAHEAMVDSVIATWSADAVAALPTARVEAGPPVFILGMPRSGTSLVEQILASHPQAHGAGELPRIHQLVGGLQPHTGPTPAYIDDLSVLTQASVDSAARDYLKTLRAQSRTAARVTDKQVFNFLYLGAIRVMFPDAPVIHCVRDPRDVAVSCFFQNFMGLVYFANRLDHIGVFYAAYRRLMDHWRSVLTGPIFEARYEELISSQEQVSRQLVEFVGLDWDDACLRFYETKRTVRTASIDQVRRPVYQSSVERWRHYEAHLEPIMTALMAGSDTA
ncbi:MAG: tetratricopeptide repeat-containing sulfotransferase family protein [Planctomycetota bacterium]|jgi:tetratricopeptide (TPR) repeat protein